MYGKELILDLHGCDVSQFTRPRLRKFFKELCILIDMRKEKLVWWDDFNVPLEERQSDPNLVGTSAVQFILTSSITIHTLDLLKKVYVNIFSCKDFDSDLAASFTNLWFGGKIVKQTEVTRI